MHEAITHYLTAGYKYNFDSGPDKIRSREEALSHGLNCGTLVHLLIREIFAVELPPRLMCLEMFHDSRFFRTLESWERLELGDVMFVGSVDIANQLQRFVPIYTPDGRFANWEEHPKLHLALFNGGDVTSDEATFIHATQFGRSVALWTTSDFRRYKTYNACYARRRLWEPLLAPR